MNSNRSRAAAFTLVELLIVMSVLGMLTAIILPSLARAPELARSAVCKNSLHQLGTTVHTLGGENSRRGSVGLGYGPRLPLPDEWDVLIHRAERSEYLFCPSADEPQVDYSSSLRDAYIRQDAGGETTGIYISYIYDMLFEDYVNDPQIYYMFQGRSNGSYDSWGWAYELNGGEPEDNEALITIATCAAVKVTFTDSYIEYTPLGHAPNWNSGSSHWVCQGDPDDAGGWQDDVLVRLTGVSYDVVNDPVRAKTYHQTSYGMNNLVPPHTFRTGQLMLTEYSGPIVRIDPMGPVVHEPFDGIAENGEIQDRHLGKANLVRVDGSVAARTKDELAGEFARLDDRESLWAK